jgi:hypothetical protein
MGFYCLLADLITNYIFKYKQAVFAHYLSDVIPLFLF